MDSSSAKIRFSIEEGSFEIHGSELFVAQQVEKFEDLINASLGAMLSGSVGQRRLLAPPATIPPASSPAIAENDGFVPSENPYPNVLDVADGKVTIIKSIKGTTTADKAVKLCLAFLKGRELATGEATASAQELRDVCKEHACLDSSNFASTLAGKKQWLIPEGVRGSNMKSYRLTQPGKEHAAALLSELNG